MKNILLILAMVALCFGANAQTNNLEVADGGKEFGGYELTLGGGGTHINGENTLGLDVSLSTNPLSFAPSLWFGVVQGVYWEPTFSGSTDVNVNWSWQLYKSLYLNTGWSAGALYDTEFDPIWRTGPEATFQYYVGDGAFLYTGVNYDIPLNGGERGFRYSVGVGLAF
jgi:hypothetical protein